MASKILFSLFWALLREVYFLSQFVDHACVQSGSSPSPHLHKSTNWIWRPLIPIMYSYIVSEVSIAKKLKIFVLLWNPCFKTCKSSKAINMEYWHQVGGWITQPERKCQTMPSYTSSIKWGDSSTLVGLFWTCGRSLAEKLYSSSERNGGEASAPLFLCFWVQPTNPSPHSPPPLLQ